METKGFSIIELLIVIGIIGILAALAVPFYQDYVIRARVTEGLTMVTPAKLVVSEYVAMHRTLPASQAEVNYVTPNPTDNVDSITIAPGGVITILFSAQAGDGTIILTPTITPSIDVAWDCTGGDLEDKYRPPNCR